MSSTPQRRPGRFMVLLRRALSFRSSGKRAGHRSTSDVAKGIVAWVAVTALTGIIGGSAYALWTNLVSTSDTPSANSGVEQSSSVAASNSATDEANAGASPKVAESGPIRFNVTLGSVNAPSAIFPSGEPNLPPPEGYRETLQWIFDNDGVLADETLATLRVAAPDAIDDPVYIDDVRIVPVLCQPALAGYLLPGLGAGDVFDRLLEYHLDDVTGANPLREAYGTEGSTQWRFPLWVDFSESEVIAITSAAYSGFYEFHIEIDYSLGSKNFTRIVKRSDNGQVLAVSGRMNAGDVIWSPPWDPSETTTTSRDRPESRPDYAPDPYPGYNSVKWPMDQDPQPSSC